MRYDRRIRYYYLRFIRLRGEPHELALGMAFGIFAGMMPIMPFQIALAVTMALLFKASKITAALGTWVSNPLNWYFLYYFTYKIGAAILGFSETNKFFPSILESAREGEGALVVIGKIAGAGGAITASLLLGGIIVGILTALPSYIIFLRVFQFIRVWRRKRRNRKFGQDRISE